MPDCPYCGKQLGTCDCKPSAPDRGMVKWPEKKWALGPIVNGLPTLTEHDRGFNEAIDACKQAHSEAEPLKALEEAIELLDSCSGIFDEMDSITWNEDSGWQHSSYTTLQDDVNNFLETNLLKRFGGSKVGTGAMGKEEIKSIIRSYLKAQEEMHSKAIKEGDWGTNGAWSTDVEEMIEDIAHALVSAQKESKG